MAIDSSMVKLMELRDCQVFPLLSDTTGAIGGATYGAAVDLTGVMSIQITPTIETKELRGDSAVLDTYSKIVAVEFTVENCVASLLGLGVIQGGAVKSEGTGASEKVIYSLTADNVTPPYFKLEGMWTYFGETAGGSAHVVLHKCKTTKPPDITINDASGEFGTVSFTATAIMTKSDGKWMDILLNATAEPIPATFPTAAPPVEPTPPEVTP